MEIFMNVSMSYIKDNQNYWTVMVNNKPYMFNPTHENYDKLVECVKNSDAKEFVKLVDKVKGLKKWCDGHFSIEGGVLTYKGEEVVAVVSKYILEMIDQGFNYKPMLAFLENLYQNPSNRAVNELYTFLTHKHLPITPDGCFLAYKAVAVYDGPDIVDLNGRTIKKGDYVDKYTGHSYRNNVGDNPNMPRRHVNDNCSIGCSDGLHVGSIDYVKSYGGQAYIICKVNPANVVSVPLDCSHQKVRCSEYLVVDIFDTPFESVVVSKEDDDVYYEPEDEDVYYDEESEYDGNHCVGEDSEDDDYVGFYDSCDDEDDEFDDQESDRNWF